MTKITNGDKLVIAKLDTCVSDSMDDENDANYAVMIDRRNLVDEKKRRINFVKDLLDLPRSKMSPLLQHPVTTIFIQNHWSKVWWTFLISFFLYLCFVSFFSIYLWMMYARYSLADLIRIPVKFPGECDTLEPIEQDSIKFGLKSGLSETSDSLVGISQQHLQYARRGEARSHMKACNSLSHPNKNITWLA